MTDTPDSPRSTRVLIARIAGMSEVSAYLGITTPRMTNLRYAVNAPFPRPIRELKGGNLWDLDDILEYARLYPSKIGTPDAPVRAEL